MDESDLNLFPLHTVLYPGMPLQLRIFEPRYLDMISACLKQDKSFGVCLIKRGDEVGKAPEIFALGTEARIKDWHLSDDGLLEIDVLGQNRFQVINQRVESNQLITSTVNYLANEPTVLLNSRYANLAEILRSLLHKLAPLYKTLQPQYNDASWLGYRLAELLPLPIIRKQYFLELEDPITRLQQLNDIVDSVLESEAEE